MFGISLLITGDADDGSMRVWRVVDWSVADSFQGLAFRREVEPFPELREW